LFRSLMRSRSSQRVTDSCLWSVLPACLQLVASFFRRVADNTKANRLLLLQVMYYIQFLRYLGAVSSSNYFCYNEQSLFQPLKITSSSFAFCTIFVYNGGSLTTVTRAYHGQGVWKVIAETTSLLLISHYWGT
jgi:hypothetical protein